MDYLFQWTDKEGVGHRMRCMFSDEASAWHSAFKKCGWENRTTLGIVGDDKHRQIRDGIIKNWWDAMKDSNLYKFNTLYFSGNLRDKLESGFLKIVEV